ncbi:MAG: ester cyclase, partial [Gemmatimonadales bacterium]
MTAVVTPLDAAHAYFDAWNRRDPFGIVATFLAGGTYSDPATGGELSGGQIAGYAEALFTAYPDLSFEIGEVRVSRSDTVIGEWVMRGTNRGPLGGKPPSGGTVGLPGIDVIEVIEGRVGSVRGYFDRQTMMEQMGLQVIVSPCRMGNVWFGSCLHLMVDDPRPPGAFSLTRLEVRSEEEREKVVEDVRRMLPELATMHGFLGTLATKVGDRMFTITAWADPNDVGQLRDGSHAASVRRVYNGEIGRAGQFGVWVPSRLTPFRIRCESCAAWAQAGEAEARCQCGAALP